MMKLSSSSHPPGSPNNSFHGYSPPPNFRHGGVVDSQLPETGGTDNKVYVAVGKSVDKGIALLQWSLKMFDNQEVCILHVHRLSPFIPTLLGKLPASRASKSVLSAFRSQEQEETKKLLQRYISICSRAKIKASFISIEADEVQKGIVDLINKHSIRKLVIGASPELLVKKRFSKASCVAKNAPFSCELWCVNKGKLIWKRHSCKSSSFVAPDIQIEPPLEYNLRSLSLHSIEEESIFQSSTTLGMKKACSDSNNEAEKETLHDQIEELKMELEDSKNKVITELFKCKKIEAISKEAINKAETFEAAQAQEIELRKESEQALNNTIQEQEKLIQESKEMTFKLQKSKQNVTLLETRAQKSNHRYKEVSEELNLIEASLTSLLEEKEIIKKQKNKALSEIKYLKKSNNLLMKQDLEEFSLIDLETATCNFSESFRIGHGGYGTVYKGELSNMTVSIKKLHPHNVQNYSDFHHQVEILGKIRHPHLVSLIGISSEAWSLVSEYIPGGTLQDHLIHRRNTNTNPSLNWKTRINIISQIANALFFLHTHEEKLVHGDLKPDNILLNAKNSCKLSDFGIYSLTPKQTFNCTEPKGVFPYTDPEFHRTGILTTKSDMYSFGVIILQLLTGKSPGGLVYEIRKAISCRKLVSILDPCAGEWSSFVARRLVEFSLQCCELKSKDRPILTPILLTELENLSLLEEKPVPSSFLCPIIKEVMHDPQVAADGFTYEREAILEWLENGHETSPMTNLRLSFSDLTPNHFLRFAIQDWVCKS